MPQMSDVQLPCQRNNTAAHILAKIAKKNFPVFHTPANFLCDMEWEWGREREMESIVKKKRIKAEERLRTECLNDCV